MAATTTTTRSPLPRSPRRRWPGRTPRGWPRPPRRGGDSSSTSMSPYGRAPMDSSGPGAGAAVFATGSVRSPAGIHIRQTD
ncbi:hypothetical protein Ddc_24328 [Ditylenchus destructor]|nr:hypothetical protein Ddc_24328 [Ditylenchus destructor]